MIWPDDYINKIICGDCLDILRGMPDKCVDLVLTDPPYGIGIQAKHIRHNGRSLQRTQPQVHRYRDKS